MAKQVLVVQGIPVAVIPVNGEDYISLTDMVRESANGSSIIENWLRNKNTLEFLAVWEAIYNPSFNSLEFEGIKSEARLNRFAISIKQSERHGALNATAIAQLQSLLNSSTIKRLK